MLSAAVLTLALAASSARAQLPSSSSDCPKVQILIARQSDAPPGAGAFGATADEIAADYPGTLIYAIEYPATIANYGTSAAAGTIAMMEALNNVTSTCPDTKVVLAGVSQGAHVIGDALCGGGLPGWPGVVPNPPVSEDVASKVIAMVQLADPRHLANKTYDVGTSITDGIFPRPANESCDKYGDIIQSYCDVGDVYCAAGDNDTVHGLVVKRHGEEARKFIEERIKGGASSTNSTGTPPSGNSTTTPPAGNPSNGTANGNGTQPSSGPSSPSVTPNVSGATAMQIWSWGVGALPLLVLSLFL